MAWKEPKVGPKIANFNHRIALCTMLDVVNNNGEMTLTRRPVAWLWAGIRQPRGSFVGASGYAIMEDANKWLSHIITFRMQAQLSVSSAAWVYEELRLSPPRWYKILGFIDQDRWVRLNCRLHERSDFVTPPYSPLAAEPQDVDLP